MLVDVMNPTHKGDVEAGEVGQRAMDRYLSRLSGPLLDRIDIHVEAPAVPWKELSQAPRGTTSAQMREQTRRARGMQEERQGAGTPNARLSGRQLDELAPMEGAARNLVGRAMTVQETDIGWRDHGEPFGLMFRALDDLKPGENVSVQG